MSLAHHLRGGADTGRIGIEPSPHGLSATAHSAANAVGSLSRISRSAATPSRGKTSLQSARSERPKDSSSKSSPSQGSLRPSEREIDERTTEIVVHRGENRRALAVRLTSLLECTCHARMLTIDQEVNRTDGRGLEVGPNVQKPRDARVMPVSNRVHERHRKARRLTFEA